MYEAYKAARDAAWQTLIDCGITTLPVDLSRIAGHYGYEVVLYSQSPLAKVFNFETASGDGFITKVGGTTAIFINDRINSRGRRRFTLGHELGHGIMGHPLKEIAARNSEQDSKIDPKELQANVFSRDILAPACVLEALQVSTAEEIMRLCVISRKSAEIRLERLLRLRARGSFGASALERRVMAQFKDYVEHKKKEGYS